MDKVLFKPDLIITWPKHLDFPLWRQQLRDNRNRFNKVIIVFTEMNVGKDYSKDIKSYMLEDNVTFVDNDPVYGKDDWRNVATRKALDYSDSEWIFFTEPDFFWGELFWQKVYDHINKVGYIRVNVEGRVHPCCIIIKHSVLNKTDKNFSVTPNISDHFGKIQDQLFREPYYEIPHNYWTHLGGLSQNMYIMMNGGTVEYEPKAFRNYVEECLEVEVPMHNDFRELLEGFLL